MRIGPFIFGKKDIDKSAEIAPSQDPEIVYSGAGDDVDLSLYRILEINPDSVGGHDFFDALIPLAGNVAEAAAQYDHAIVKFPKDIGWNDLLNRKTPGWEQFKQCGGFGKNGKFNPQAAIRQVKVSPAAVANIALQAAAVAVGQAYMTEISERLSSIEEGISTIQREMRRERDSKIEASFRMLRDYIEHYAEYSEIPEKSQAVQNELEGIKRDTLAAWSFQIQCLNDLGSQVKKAGRLDSAGIRSFLSALESCDSSAAAVYTVLLMENQAELQYGGSFDLGKLKNSERRALVYFEEYDRVRSGVQESLRKKIEALKGKPFVAPKLENDGYEAKNPVAGVVHNTGRNARRFLPPTMRAEAKRTLSAQKRGLSAAASTNGPLTDLAEKRRSELKLQNEIFNEATAIVIEKDKICLLIPRNASVAEGDEPPA